MLMATQYSACRGESVPVSVRSCSARAVVDWEAFARAGSYRRESENDSAGSLWRRPPISRQQGDRQKERPPRAVDDTWGGAVESFSVGGVG
jgi:hypothetical protein